MLRRLSSLSVAALIVTLLYGCGNEDAASDTQSTTVSSAVKRSVTVPAVSSASEICSEDDIEAHLIDESLQARAGESLVVTVAVHNRGDSPCPWPSGHQLTIYDSSGAMLAGVITEIDCAGSPCRVLEPGEVAEFSETWDLTYVTGVGDTPMDPRRAEPGSYGVEFSLRLREDAEAPRSEEFSIAVASTLSVVE